MSVAASDHRFRWLEKIRESPARFRAAAASQTVVVVVAETDVQSQVPESDAVLAEPGNLRDGGLASEAIRHPAASQIVWRRVARRASAPVLASHLIRSVR